MNDKDIWKDYQSVWSRLDHLLPDNPYMAMPSADKPSPAGDSPKRPVVFRRLRWAVAAAVCGVLVAGGMLWWHAAEPPMAVPQPTEPLVASVSPTAYTVPQPTARRRVAVSQVRHHARVVPPSSISASVIIEHSVLCDAALADMEQSDSVMCLWNDFGCNTVCCVADAYYSMLDVAFIDDSVQISFV